jgi:trimeric autotransporter adhesin
LKEVTVKERGSKSVKIAANEIGGGMYIYALIVDGKVVDTKVSV